MTGVMPVLGSRAKSSAMICAVPRRNAYGEEIMRPTRTGISQSRRPSWARMMVLTGSGRPGVAFQCPSDARGARSRSRRPSTYRWARGVAGRRSEANASASAAERTTVPICAEPR
jgi:hypothetical protein